MIQGQDITQKIIKYIIKQTPFGETKEVIKDLCKIITSLNPQDPIILQALQEHNEQHLAVFKGTDNTYIISSELNQQEPTKYADQKKQVSVTVDHSLLTIVSVETIEIPQNQALDAFRDQMEIQLTEYVKQHYKQQLSGFYVLYVGDENEYTYYIGISAKNINLPNFYCGDWVSRWELNKSGLSGSLSLQAHYYEEGNVQLKNTNQLAAPLSINLQEPTQSAKLFIEALSKLENNHQNSMDNIYNGMPDTFFKAMRRVLPVSGTKFQWNSQVHKVAHALKNQ